MAPATTTLRLRIAAPTAPVVLPRNLVQIVEACDRHGVDLALRV